MSRNLAFLCTALTALAGVSAIPARGDEPAAASQADPIEWRKPDKAAEFREVLKGNDYTLAFKQAASKIDIAALEKADQPIAGQRVLAVLPGTQAARIGLKVGDLVTMLDGAQVWEHFLRSPDQPQMMTFVDKAGTRRNAQIQPGMIGINARFQWQAEFEYLRGRARNPRWDKEVLVGILMRSSNPDLAETALHHAVHAGLTPDQLIDGVGAEIALEQGRNDAALDFVWSALVEHDTRPAQLNPTVLYRAAIANYKLDVAAEVLNDYAGAQSAEPAMLRRLAKMHRARPVQERSLPAPSEQVAGLRRLDLAPVLEPASDLTPKEWKDVLMNGMSFQQVVHSSHFDLLAFKFNPAVRDMEAVVKLTIRPTDNDKTEYARAVEVFLSDLSENRAESKFIGNVRKANQLYVGLHSETSNAVQPIILSHSGISGTTIVFEDPMIRLDGKQEIELRLLRIGGQGEVFVNGRRMLYVPIDEKIDNLGFTLKIIGMTVEVKELHLNKLVPKAVVHQADDGTIALAAVDANLHGNRIKYEMGNDKKCIGYWDDEHDWADWDIQIDKPGKFEVSVSSACPTDLAGSKYVVAAGAEKVNGEVKETGDWSKFATEKLGAIEIPKAGRASIAIKVTSKPGSHVMNLRQIELRPAK